MYPPRSALLAGITERRRGKQSAEIDPLLEPLLSPVSDEEIAQFLSRIIPTHAEPMIRGIIHYKLHLNSHAGIGQADADDIHQEVVVQLLVALRQFRQQPADHPIGDLRGLTAVIAHRACSRWMRRRFPERHAFKNRLSYFLTHHGSFALWQSENSRLMAGFAIWQGEDAAVTEEQLKGLSDDEGVLSRIRLLKSGKKAEWIGALSAIFNRLGAPIEIDRLVGVLAALLQLENRRVESIDQMQETGELEASTGQPDAVRQTEKRIFLQRLWEEVRQLPLNQRAALLLNLRDHQGMGCLALFPALGIATPHQMAETLEMGVEKLAELYDQLPLEDAKIAELLRLTRQQVISARQSARRRLTRRLKGFF
jgi:DNA-directed RNA polymerase specialized sigma24 family protein